MVEVCKENNVILTLNYVMRHHPIVKKTKEFIDNKYLGKIVSISAKFNFDYKPNDNFRFNLSESGGGDFIKPEESKAILFAQYFADSRGFPKKYAYDSIVKEYGEKKAQIILSASQMMIVGNMYGIPLSAFLSRIKGKPYKDSSLFYELRMEILGILFLPIAIVHGFLRGLIGLPNKRLDNSTTDKETQL